MPIFRAAVLISCTAAVALLGLTACGSDGPTAVASVTVTATFTAPSADPGAGDMASPVTGAAPGTIRVTGSVRLPAPCYDMSARAAAGGQFITLDITAERRSSGCAAQVSQVTYDVVIGGLQAGSRTIAVRHALDNGLFVTSTDVVVVPVTVR